MKISNLLDKDSIIVNLKSTDKKGVLEELAVSISKRIARPAGDIVKVLLEREQLGSTGIGGGIGIPHGKLEGINSTILGLALSREGVDFDSLDNKPVHIFCVLVTSSNSTGMHLSVLAQISKLLKQTHFKDSLLKADSFEEIEQIIQAVEEDF